MSDKSEALKLADVVDVFDAQNERLPLELYSDISSELRRLHAVNHELLEALKAAEALMRHRDKVSDWEFGDCRTEDEMEADNAWSAEVYNARAAIAKATGENT